MNTDQQSGKFKFISDVMWDSEFSPNNWVFEVAQYTFITIIDTNTSSFLV
jgi:hypothetical protein